MDSIKGKKPCAADGIILNDWLSAGGWKDMSAQLADESWQGPNGVNPPMFNLRACKTTLNPSVKGGH